MKTFKMAVTRSFRIVGPNDLTIILNLHVAPKPLTGFQFSPWRPSPNLRPIGDDRHGGHLGYPNRTIPVGLILCVALINGYQKVKVQSNI